MANKQQITVLENKLAEREVEIKVRIVENEDLMRGNENLNSQNKELDELAEQHWQDVRECRIEIRDLKSVIKNQRTCMLNLLQAQEEG